MCNFIENYYNKNISNEKCAASSNNYKSAFPLKADTYESKYSIKTEDKQKLKRLLNIFNGPISVLTNKTTIVPTHAGESHSPVQLSKASKTTLVYPDISNESLLLIGQLCDDNCVEIFTNKHVYILKNYELLVKGDIHPGDGLWDILLQDTRDKDTSNIYHMEINLNCIIHHDKTKHELAHYLHACAFSPKI